MSKKYANNLLSMIQVHSTGMNVWGSGIDRSKKGLGIGFWIWVHYHNKYLEYAGDLYIPLLFVY